MNIPKFYSYNMPCLKSDIFNPQLALELFPTGQMEKEQQ